jgi:hypothetical protein
MRNLSALAAVGVVAVALLATASADATDWTVRGDVYIDEWTPAPCVQMVVYGSPNCTGAILCITTTDCDGHFECLVHQDSVWVKMNFTPGTCNPCECHYDPSPWCQPATECQIGIHTAKEVLHFVMDQPDCDCSS